MNPHREYLMVAQHANNDDNWEVIKFTRNYEGQLTSVRVNCWAVLGVFFLVAALVWSA